jgi:subtilisin
MPQDSKGSDTKPVSRRDVLKTTSGAIVAGVVAGAASASEDGNVEVNVGFSSEMGAQAARDTAIDTKREFAFDAMTVEIPEERVEALEKNPNIRYVEENGEMQALAQSTPYGIETVGADLAISEGETGDGADVAVIDTGIDATHEDLEGILGEGWAASGAACQNDCTSGLYCNPNDISSCNAEWDDDNDHGTHCAGTVAAIDNDTGVVGVAPDVTLHAVKVLDCCGSGGYDDIAAGIEWTADQGYDVGSLSLGGDSSSVVKDAVQYARDRGVLLVAAAGNDGECSDCVGYPAAYEEVIAVSATDENDNLTSFSSTGPEVEIAAPGANVLSSIPRSDYTEFSGTSMACPHVAGAGAQLMANGNSDTEARQQLKDTAEDIGLSSNEQGSGRLDVAAALGIDDGGGDDPQLAVSTGSATNVGETSATLNGSLDDLGGADNADVYFEWGPSGGSLSNVTSAETLSSTGSFSADISGLSAGTTYEFRAVANASDGSSDTGSTNSFTTDSSGGGCFITTATADETSTLNSLRRFRDESMSATPLGRGMVGLYYRISPPIAETLKRHPKSRTANVTRSIVQTCADLSNEQDETDSRVESVALGILLTQLYIVGILTAAFGHAGIRLKELLA